MGEWRRGGWRLKRLHPKEEEASEDSDNCNGDVVIEDELFGE